MKMILTAALLILASWTTQAQPVTASSDSFEFAPTLMPGDSPSQTVTFTNQTAAPIDVYGLGWAGPFQFSYECPGDPTGGILGPQASCTLSGQFQPREGQELGLAEGVVGFRVSTGTVLLDVKGFAYTDQPLAGVQNLIASLVPLGFVSPLDRQLREALAMVEGALLDDRRENDRMACGQLRRFSAQVEHQAASGAVSEWSAVAMVVQAEAIASSLDCGGSLQP